MYGCEVIGVKSLSTLYENAGQLSLAKESAGRCQEHHCIIRHHSDCGFGVPCIMMGKQYHGVLTLSGRQEIRLVKGVYPFG